MEDGSSRTGGTKTQVLETNCCKLKIESLYSGNSDHRSCDESNVRPSQIVSSLKRSANMANIATEAVASGVRPAGTGAPGEPQPYHARLDSKPFSYIRVNGANGSRQDTLVVTEVQIETNLSVPGI